MVNFKALLVGVALSSLVTAASAAELTGKIQAVDAGAITVTLQDGKIFKLPEGGVLADFAVGQDVRVVYDEATMVATEIAAVQTTAEVREEATFVVAEIDMGARTIKLEDGKVLTLPETVTFDLATLVAGQSVILDFDPDTLTIKSITTATETVPPPR